MEGSCRRAARSWRFSRAEKEHECRDDASFIDGSTVRVPGTAGHGAEYVERGGGGGRVDGVHRRVATQVGIETFEGFEGFEGGLSYFGFKRFVPGPGAFQHGFHRFNLHHSTAANATARASAKGKGAAEDNSSPAAETRAARSCTASSRAAGATAAMPPPSLTSSPPCAAVANLFRSMAAVT